ncbi:MAG: hypothetical protein WKG07_04165 [Hymenobacter sp.]
MLGGIIMNVITGIIIFTALTYKLGESYLPASEARYGVVTHQCGPHYGLPRRRPDCENQRPALHGVQRRVRPQRAAQ